MPAVKHKSSWVPLPRPFSKDGDSKTLPHSRFESSTIIKIAGLLIVCVIIAIHTRRQRRQNKCRKSSRHIMDPQKPSPDDKATAPGTFSRPEDEALLLDKQPLSLSHEQQQQQHQQEQHPIAAAEMYGEASSFYQMPLPPAYAISTPFAPLPLFPPYTNMPPVPPSPTLSLDSQTDMMDKEKKKKRDITSCTTYLRRFPNEPRILEQGQIIKGQGTRRHVRIIGAVRASNDPFAEAGPVT